MAVIEPREASALVGEAWMDDAACKGRTHLFFPPRAERPQARVRREAQARRLCHECPVSTECREFARTHREYGFWGGESEEERHMAGFTVAAPIGVRSRGGLDERLGRDGWGSPGVLPERRAAG
jgi:WhiB family transcriptional regulator, redox-sensing transcriptional regulator